MKKKYIETRQLLVLASCLLYWTCYMRAPLFCPPSAISKVESHTVIVVGNFKTEYGTYQARFGAGGILKDNYILTACHLLEWKDFELTGVLVTTKEIDHWVKADVIAQGHSFPKHDDYAVLKMQEDLGLPGLKISKKPLRLLQKVLFAGTPDGNAFFVRGGYINMFRHYVRMDGDTFSREEWAEYELPTVYMAYPGDSGGIITNTKGEIQSIMYFYKPGKIYFHGNPVSEIWKFLKKNNLEWLGGNT